MIILVPHIFTFSSLLVSSWTPVSLRLSFLPFLNLREAEAEGGVTLEQVQAAAEKAGGVHRGDIVFGQMGKTGYFSTPAGSAGVISATAVPTSNSAANPPCGDRRMFIRNQTMTRGFRNIMSSFRYHRSSLLSHRQASLAAFRDFALFLISQFVQTWLFLS